MMGWRNRGFEAERWSLSLSGRRRGGERCNRWGQSGKERLDVVAGDEDDKVFWGFGIDILMVLGRKIFLPRILLWELLPKPEAVARLA